MAAPRKKSAGEKESSSSVKVGSAPLYVIYGDDDFLVAEEAKKIIDKIMPKGGSEFGLETIDGMAANQGEAATVFKKLFDSLQSHSFFATEKVVWLRQTNLFGASTTASAQAVSDFLKSLGELLENGLPQGISLVITATDWDGRKGITKLLQKIGKVTSFKTDPYKQQENQWQAVEFARETAKGLGKQLAEDAALLVVEMSGNDRRTINLELEKLTSYVGSKANIQEADVHAIGSRRPGGVVWDLPDAVGNRDLGKALKILNDLVFLGESPIALLFAIIARMRLLLLLSALADKKLIRVGGDYNSFKGQLDRLPEWVSESLPDDKKLNPLASHPFVLWKSSSGLKHYQQAEIQEALKTLLSCNEQMVSTGRNPGKVLEDALLKICAKR